jgi:hypothetical protein
MTDKDGHGQTKNDEADTAADILDMTADLMLNRALFRLVKQMSCGREAADVRAPTLLTHNTRLSDVRRFAAATRCRVSLVIELPDGTRYGILL